MLAHFLNEDMLIIKKNLIMMMELLMKLNY